ncbi:acyltransferase family protein [Undibacterium sp. TJN25]|uniref:acyltransferase family protein n=1 Tax=Undibacterium sp. TJN25 TaxID=3413056 RepID=UPI003BF29765
MRRELSVYLDFLRLFAALAVFLSHLSWLRISGGFLWQLQPYGHSAVIVFFVLSGFVIQYTVDKKEKTFFDFSVARFARLYSVVVPALILTLVCDGIGTRHDPSVYLMERETNPLLRVVGAFFFLGQSWWWNLSMLSNDPFWSLPYEFWYYQIFGIAIFLKGTSRIIFVFLAACIAGPTILLLFPIWLFGVAAYRLTKMIILSKLAAAGLFILTSALILFLLLLDANGTIERSSSPYFPPGFSFVDFLMGLLLAINLLSVSFLKLPILWAEKTIVLLAGFTFALYLFHLPLLHLGAAFIPKMWPVAIRGICLAIFTLIVVVVIGYFTERKKKTAREIIIRLFSFLDFPPKRVNTK